MHKTRVPFLAFTDVMFLDCGKVVNRVEIQLNSVVECCRFSSERETVARAWYLGGRFLWFGTTQTDSKRRGRTYDTRGLE